ncbi:MAG TPA: phosphatidylglycerophosphatase A [Polyangia bacterium]|nr:phosphatidylglycerophosphatase A [Polyangia bacterium]
MDDVAPAAPSSSPSSTLRQRLAHVLAVWFGCGHFPRAPGTAGTVGAIPFYLLLRPHGPLAVFVAAVIVTIVGVWAAGIVERRLGKKDPQIVCIDEVAGVLLTWVAAPATSAGLIVGFVLFRLFDQFKPWPARRAERLPGGQGVMFDDVVAGAWGALVILGARRLGWL